MIDVLRVGHATFTTPDLERQVAYYSDMLGLIVTERDKNRAFLATRTDPPYRRDVLLDDPKASYGGTWTYELTPGPSQNTTTLKITETGFIRPPVYRFLMKHVIGMTHNLDEYMKDVQTAAKK